MPINLGLILLLCCLQQSSIEHRTGSAESKIYAYPVIRNVEAGAFCGLYSLLAAAHATRAMGTVPHFGCGRVNRRF